MSDTKARRDAPRLTGMSITDVVAKYAPLVVLHAEDKLRPSSADWFLARSTLRWATGRNLDGEAVAEADGDVDAGRLGATGSNPYRHGAHIASALTRPLDDNAARGGDPPLEQGFFLRLREESFARGDQGSTVYWDYDEHAKAITYWLFYPGSSPPLGILRAGEQIGTRGVPTETVPTEARSRRRGGQARGIPARLSGPGAGGRACRADARPRGRHPAPKGCRRGRARAPARGRRPPRG